MIARLLLIFVVSALCAAAASAAEPAPLSFNMFYTKVLAHYPRLQSAGAEVEWSWARKMQASAGFWPRLSVSAGYSESDDPVNVFGMLLRQERFANADFDLNRMNTPRHQRDWQGGVHVRWPLFDAMQTVRRVRAARALVKAAQSDEDFVRMEAFVLAHDAYTGAMALERMLVIAEDAGKAAEDDLKKADDLRARGMVLGADFYAARVRAGSFGQARNELLRQTKAAHMLLNIMMGASLTEEIMLPLTYPETDFAEVSAAALVERALLARPDLLAAAARVDAQHEDIKRARDSGLPTINVTADGTNNRHDLFGHGGNNASAGIVAELPVFDPARQGRVQEAQALLKRAQKQAELIKESAALDIVRETARYEALRANFPVVKAMAADAAQAVDMLLPLYNEGRKSVADLENARAARFTAAQAEEELLAALFSSEARLFFLSGQLDDNGIKALSDKITTGR